MLWFRLCPEMKMLKNISLLFFLMLLSTMISCAKTTALATGPDEADCTYGDDAYKSQCKKGRTYVRDEMELGAGGDKPFIAGCHVGYTDANCTKGRDVYIGDRCLQSGKILKLKEWTNAGCHKPGAGKPIDIKTYDCYKLCKSKGHASGKCQETVPQVCGKFSSAYCKCTGID